jgi:thymidylate synthase
VRVSGGESVSLTMARHQEYQYLDLVRRIIDSGNRRSDRTGTGTLSLFGDMSRYSLEDGVIPVLTTKRVYWKAVVEELLWFMRGSTDAKELSGKGVKIWDANASRAEQQKRGFTGRKEGDLGPVYGFQWRHFGAKYTDCDSDYSGQGVDQLERVIGQIRSEPSSRRIVLCAWNPVDEDQMALPACHCFVQFYVQDQDLSCMLTQRSADTGLGVPFNIASYSLLTHIIASHTGLRAKELVHSVGDAHVYLNHVHALEQQLTRTPRPFPRLRIHKHPIQRLEDLKFEDFELIGYDPHPPISMPMAV